MRVRSWCVCCVLLSQIALSQQQRMAYDDFVALLVNGERIEGTSCTLTPTELSGVTASRVRIAVSLDSVRTLYIATGSKSGQYALLGGGFGLGIGLCAILLAEENGNGKVNYGTIGGLTAAAVVIGAVLGAGEQSWESVDLAPFRRASKVDSSQSHPLH